MGFIRVLGSDFDQLDMLIDYVEKTYSELGCELHYERGDDYPACIELGSSLALEDKKLRELIDKTIQESDEERFEEEELDDYWR